MTRPSQHPSESLLDLAASSGEGTALLDCAVPAPDGAPARSLLASHPDAIFTVRDGRCFLRWRVEADRPVTLSEADPFLCLEGLLRQRPEWTAVGYWGYDLGRTLELMPSQAADDLDLPDCWVGLYSPEAIVTDATLMQASSSSATPLTSAALPLPVSSFSRDRYLTAVRRVLEYIAAGDCYQVNLSQRFTAPLTATPWELYHRLRTLSPAPFAAYLDCGDHQVLSSSPELFLRVRDGCVETHPIKGTRPRDPDPERDQLAAEELRASAKDRAELLMIVDLERNDLGRVCEYGSVVVPRQGGDWARLESYANVHHLVATVRGRLRDGIGPLGALRASFPGGSITGAPKIRAMQIIEELEPIRRGVYTGAIGWVDGQGNAEWSIAIRTMVAAGGKVHFHAGGGIVADSDPEAEYAETLAKAKGMLAALNAAGGPSGPGGQE